MRFMDVSDGRFVHALEDAWNEAQKGTDQAHCTAFLLLRETRMILDTAKAMGLYFPEEAKAKALEEALRTNFLGSVENLLIEILDQTDRQKNQADKIRGQFQAIRVLGIALDSCRTPEMKNQKKRLQKLHKNRLSRFVALGGTLDFAEKEVENSQEMDTSMVVETLQGCVIWHQTATLRGGSKTLENLLKTHAIQHSDLLLQDAQAANTPEQAAHSAVRSLKLFAVGHGVLPVDRLKRVWPWIEHALEASLSKTTTYPPNIAAKNFSRKQEEIDYRFWFLPKDLKSRHQEWLKQERKRLLDARIKAILSASRGRRGLHTQVSVLEDGVRELANKIPLENSLHSAREVLISKAIEKMISLSKQEIEFDKKLSVVEEGLRDLSRYLKPNNRLAREIERLLSEYVSGCVGRSRSEPSLPGKTSILIDGIENLGAYPKAGEVLQQRLKTIKDLGSKLRELATNAQISFSTKRYLGIDEALEQCREMLRSFTAHHDETVTSPYLVELEKLAKQAQQAIEQRNHMVADVLRAGLTPLGWKKATALLASESGLQQVERLQEEIEDKFSLRCNPLIVKSGKKYLLWFVRDSLTMAREGGDVPLSLKGASGEPKVIAFQWSNGQASVTDHGSTYGLFQALATGMTGRLQRRGIHYNRTHPNTPVTLEEKGELVMGHWARLAYQVMPFGLVLTFLDPFLPEEIDQRYEKNTPLETVWPDWQEEVQQTIILAPRSFPFVSSREGVEPVADDGAFSLERAGNSFVVRSLSANMLKIEDISTKSCPVMSGFGYRVDQSEIVFEEKKNHAQ